ncbi:MAG: peptidylprolyl isomerase [Pseudomonadota bacterium]
MYRVLAGFVAALAAGPALATGLEIAVAGEANGTITIDLLDDVAPEHVARIAGLAEAGAYDDVVFHRVIDGFMAQTGDVEFGKQSAPDFNMSMAGRGGSDQPDLPAEFSDTPFDRGVVGMARSQDPNSANSQFFIMFAPAPHLNGQYTVVGQVTGGLEVLDAIKRGTGGNGAVVGEPDRMVSVTVTE